MAAASRKPAATGHEGQRLLGVYLNDHLAGSTAGVQLLQRLVKVHRGSPAGPVLARLHVEVAADRDTLRSIMRALGVEEARYKLAAAWAAEKAGRFKANGYLLRRSPLSSVVELETMMLGVAGKAALWRVLHDLALEEPRLDAAQLESLLARADRQGSELEELRARHAAAAFSAVADGR